MAPQLSRPFGLPGVYAPNFGVLLTVDGTLKTYLLQRFRQVQRHFPSTAVMLSGTEWVYKVKT